MPAGLVRSWDVDHFIPWSRHPDDSRDNCGIGNGVKWKLPTVATLLVVVALAVGGALAGWRSTVAPTWRLVTQPVPWPGWRLAICRCSGTGPNSGGRKLARRTDSWERLASAAVPDFDGPAQGPSFLLRPALEVVDFTGRETELAGLRDWCRLDEPRSVRVIAGPGRGG